MGNELVGNEYYEQVIIKSPIPAGTNTIGVVETTFDGMAYLGEQTITCDGNSQAATLPTGTNMIQIYAETGAVRFSLNGAASANSGGYIPQDFYTWVPKISNLTSLAVFGTSGNKAHLLYFAEP